MNNTKKYSKPQIVFESFELSTNIAAGCTFQADHYQGSCAYNGGIGGLPIFTFGASCSFSVEDGDGGVCYYIPNGDNNVFAS